MTGAVEYEVERSANGTTWSVVATTSAAEAIDATVAANTAYLYRVRAINGSHESVSNADLATTVTYSDAAIAPGMPFLRRHILETRTSVNAVRALAGLGAGTYLDPAIAAGSPMKARHVSDVRSELQEALSELGLPSAVPYSRTPAAGRVIYADDIQEVRDAVE